MRKNMTNEEKDNYIKYLEDEVKKLSSTKNNNNQYKNYDMSVLLKAQEDFLVYNYADKDNLITENRRLTQEIARLTRTIIIDNNYINYLLNSFWWKVTMPFRLISRILRRKIEKTNYDFVENIIPDKSYEIVKEKVSVVIFTYNAGEEFTVQLKNIKNQKQLANLEIVIIDKGSVDNTIKYSKRIGAKTILFKDDKLTNDEIYEQCISNISGKYIVLIDQNKIIDSKYWIYQAIRPILDDKAVSTVFFKEDVSKIREVAYYKELKERMATIAGEQVIFFPENRDIIQYLSPLLLDKSCALVKKRISNIFFI